MKKSYDAPHVEEMNMEPMVVLMSSPTPSPLPPDPYTPAPRRRGGDFID